MLEIINKKVYCGFLCIFMSITFIGCKNENKSNQNPTANIQTQPTSEPINEKKVEYKLTDKQKKLVRFLVKEELSAYLQGRKIATTTEFIKKILGDYTMVSAKELQTEYERNEVSADIKFRKKRLLIKGVVASIDRSIGENYFIALKGGSNPFMHPKAAMADGYIDFMANLNKGDSIELVCSGNGMLIGSAMLASCEPTLAYVSSIANNYAEQLNKIDKSSIKELDGSTLQFFALTLDSLLPDSSACYDDEVDQKKCAEEIKKLATDQAKMKSAMEAVESKLRMN